jgi:hypothetical protein
MRVISRLIKREFSRWTRVISRLIEKYLSHCMRAISRLIEKYLSRIMKKCLSRIMKKCLSRIMKKCFSQRHLRQCLEHHFLHVVCKQHRWLRKKNEITSHIIIVECVRLQNELASSLDIFEKFYFVSSRQKIFSSQQICLHFDIDSTFAFSWLKKKIKKTS